MAAEATVAKPEDLKRNASEMSETMAMSKADPSTPTFEQYLNARNRVRVLPDTKCSTYYIGGVQIHFPFAPYPSQLGMMNHMVRALNGSHNTMIESPTGSGKSLALLCAALGWRRHFAAKRSHSNAGVIQVIRKFAKHNSLPDFKDDKESVPADGGPSNGAKDEPVSSCKTPEAPDQQKPDESKGTDQSVPDIKLETESKTDASVLKTTKDGSDAKDQPTKPQSDADIERIRLGVALGNLSQTTAYILKLAALGLPPGLDADDIAKLEDYQKSFAHVTGTPRIYFGSRTHKQVSQLVDELRRKTPYRVPMAVLGSRKQMCIHRRARKADSVDEACSELKDKKECGPFTRYRNLIGAKPLAQGGENEIWDIEDLVNLGKQTMACPYYASREIAAQADLIFCPYNYILDPAVREAAGISLEGNIVILDEAHNIEGAARDAASKEITDTQLGILYNECENMVKENVLPDRHSRIAKMAENLCFWLRDEQNTYEFHDYETKTCVWPKPDVPLDNLLTQLGFTLSSVLQLESDFNAIDKYIAELHKSKEDFGHLDGIFSQDEEGQGSKYAKRAESLIPHLSGPSMRNIGGLLSVLKHILMNGGPFKDDYRIARIRAPNPLRDSNRGRNHRQSWGLDIGEVPHFVNTLVFWAMSPGIVFAEISQLSRTIVLTSGTLSPIDSYASELRTGFQSTLEANHVVDPSRFKAMCIKTGPSGGLLEGKYKNADMLSFQDDLGKAIALIAERCPDGMLVFVTSYSLLNKLIARWKVTGDFAEIAVHKEIFTEGKGSTKEEFDKLLNDFRKLMKKDGNDSAPLARGAIMFAVYRGKVSEGIDFSDHLCRTIVNIGIPYPAFKDVKVILKRGYNDSHCSSPQHQRESLSNQVLSGSKWYDIQAFRAINQALGRCLRHKMDWGAIILLESRFSFAWNTSQLSKWIRNHVQVYHEFSEAKDVLDEFYAKRIQDDKDSNETVVNHSPVDDDDE
ncbi:Fanconi anemia group J protein [Coemansia sp. RSA 1933]|nr:Fanconi anemia group J protein [Coemansia sp. RSA 1933]